MTIEEAGKLYKKYQCNLFYADHDGDSINASMYRMLRISKEQERIWMEEYITEHCDIIINDPEAASNLGNYLSVYEVIPYLYHDSDNLYYLCNRIIDTIDFGIKFLNPYCRINLAECICRKHNSSNTGIFINIVAKANKSKKDLNQINLVDNLSNKVFELLGMKMGITKDFYDYKYQDRILKQFEQQLNAIKSGKIASEYKES